MPLNAEAQNKTRAWLEDQEASCPICKARSWRFGDIVQSEVLNTPSSYAYGSHVPMIQVICGHCAYVALFDAQKIGLLE
jgi:C4-type Zn-finger protein